MVSNKIARRCELLGILKIRQRISYSQTKATVWVNARAPRESLGESMPCSPIHPQMQDFDMPQTSTHKNEDVLLQLGWVSNYVELESGGRWRA